MVTINAKKILNQRGIHLLHEFEACRLKAYKCSADVWTIGWGDTNRRGVKVVPGQVITQEQADKEFELDVVEYGEPVRSHVKVPLTDDQYAALVSFAYNAGTQAFISSTMLKLINQGKYQEASKEFNKWSKVTKDGKKVLDKGVLRRRLSEKNLFLGKEEFIVKSLDNVDWKNKYLEL